MSYAFKLQAGPIHVAAVTVIAALGWRFGVRPLEAKAMDLRSQADAAEQVITDAKSIGEDIAPDAGIVRQVKAADERLSALASAGQRQSRMHEEVAKVVQECGVRLASIEPRGKSAAAVSNNAVKVTAVAWTVEASGTFDGLTRVLDVLEDRIPLTRVHAFRLVGGGPTPGASEAVLTFDLTSFVVAQTGVEPSVGAGKAGSQAKKSPTSEVKQ